MNEIINDAICPFCNNKNQCMAHFEEPCWCNSINVPDELRAIVPEKTRDKVCICLKCIQLFKENPAEFKRRMNLSV